MALQLGFEGAVKLIDQSSIPAALDLTIGRYEEYVHRLAHPHSEESTYWRIVFSILTVRTAFDATVQAYERLRENGEVPRSQDILARWLAEARGERTGMTVQYPGQKARYLRAFSAKWREDPKQFTSNGDKSTGWRDRLIKEVTGLARAKASFAVCLADPLGSDVICLDRHMCRLMLGYVPTGRIPTGRYDRAERKLLTLARAYKVPPFAVQWCLWDAVRGSIEPHASLWEV